MIPEWRHCPVCWQAVRPTPGYRIIVRHWDSIGRDVCPMSGEPFDMAEIGHRAVDLVAA